MARAHCELQARQDDSAAARAGLAALVDLGLQHPAPQRLRRHPSSSATARNGATRPAAERAAADLLAALGVELDAEHLREMPRRVAQAYAELLTPRPFNPTTFPNDERYDELVVVDDIRFQSRSAPSAPLVLLLEAGPRDARRRSASPRRSRSCSSRSSTWGYETTPQRGLNGRRLYFPRGKTLGGSSAMNAQMHIPGHPADKPTSDSSACNGPFPLWAGRRMGGGAGLFSQPQKGGWLLLAVYE